MKLEGSQNIRFFESVRKIRQERLWQGVDGDTRRITISYFEEVYQEMLWALKYGCNFKENQA